MLSSRVYWRYKIASKQGESNLGCLFFVELKRNRKSLTGCLVTSDRWVDGWIDGRKDGCIKEMVNLQFFQFLTLCSSFVLQVMSSVEKRDIKHSKVFLSLKLVLSRLRHDSYIHLPQANGAIKIFVFFHNYTYLFIFISLVFSSSSDIGKPFYF